MRSAGTRAPCTENPPNARPRACAQSRLSVVTQLVTQWPSSPTHDDRFLFPPARRPLFERILCTRNRHARGALEPLRRSCARMGILGRPGGSGTGYRPTVASPSRHEPRPRNGPAGYLIRQPPNFLIWSSGTRIHGAGGRTPTNSLTVAAGASAFPFGTLRVCPDRQSV